jgi:hypothetical protein
LVCGFGAAVALVTAHIVTGDVIFSLHFKHELFIFILVSAHPRLAAAGHHWPRIFVSSRIKEGESRGMKTSLKL